MSIRIAVDLGGSELKLDQLLDACKQVLQDKPDITLGLFGNNSSDITQYIPESLMHRIKWHPTAVIMPNTISIMEALRNYRQSSMGLALQSVRNGQYSVAISCGNTGALVALSAVIIGRIKGINRPAIFSPFPTKSKPLYMLDLGANHESSAQDLSDFALMGEIAARTMGIKEPAVSLLNIGSEDRKGHQIIQKAHFLLHQHPKIHYIGFVEPNQLFNRPCDVIVCDGFSGNLVLKSVEGTADYFLKQIKNLATDSLLNKMLMYPLRKAFKNKFDRLQPDRHNGAILLGLANTVIKSHGSCSRDGFYHALLKAETMAKHNLAASIKEAFAVTQTEEAEAVT